VRGLPAQADLSVLGLEVTALVATLVAASAVQPPPSQASPPEKERTPMARERRIPVGSAELYAREIGQGQPVIVLHGGPDFDHTYLLPDLDRLADAFRLIYYDQRGRGRSADGVRPEDVSLESEMSDLDAVRRSFQLGSTAILGHSWGTVLALEYAIRHPERVSHLILMNPAPASHRDLLLLRKERAEKMGADLEGKNAIAATDAYKNGDPDTVVAYYRIHFAKALARPEDLEKLMAVMAPSFNREGVLKARKIEDRLVSETWLSSGYDLTARIGKLRIPTLVLYGDHDLVPSGVSAGIARAIPGARLVTLENCGHFSYLECPDAVRREIDATFQRR
jgi:proline iminopeptidase